MKRFRTCDGAAAVEMGLLLPLLVMLAFGIIEFSTAYNRSQGMEAAVREGARLGVTSSVPQPVTLGEVKARTWAALQSNEGGSGFPAPGGSLATPEAQVEADVVIEVANLPSATAPPTTSLASDSAVVCEGGTHSVHVKAYIASGRQDDYGLMLPLLPGSGTGTGLSLEASGTFRCLR